MRTTQPIAAFLRTMLILPGLLIALHSGSAAEPKKIDMSASQWTTTGPVEFVQHMGASAIELKPGNYAQHQPSGSAILNDLSFRNGTIEYDVDPTGSMGAGFAFRMRDKDTYELFYLRPRPKCSEAVDCIQYAPQTHGVLLWDLFPQYQSPAPLIQGQWNHVKLVISGQRMNIFINGEKQPSLKIGRLEGDSLEGGLMLQGPGIFANLTVLPDETENLPEQPEPDATASDAHYLRQWQVSPFSKLAADHIPTAAEIPATSASWTALPAERSGLVNVTRLYGLPLDRADRSFVWLKTTLDSATAQQKHVSIGWSREIWIFVNGKQVFADKNLYQPPNARKTPDGRLSLENGSFDLPLRKGSNDITVALANNFYGWGLELRLDDIKGLHLTPGDTMASNHK